MVHYYYFNLEVTFDKHVQDRFFLQTLLPSNSFFKYCQPIQFSRSNLFIKNIKWETIMVLNRLSENGYHHTPSPLSRRRSRWLIPIVFLIIVLIIIVWVSIQIQFQTQLIMGSIGVFVPLILLYSVFLLTLLPKRKKTKWKAKFISIEGLRLIFWYWSRSRRLYQPT